jgi:hypothetical protein
MNSYNIVNLYKKRSEKFTERTVSMLECKNFAEDYNKEIDGFHLNLLEIGCEECSAAEETLDFSASLADEYMLLSDGIYSAVLTSFYHLWERDIKDLCKRLLQYHPVEEDSKRVTEKMLQNYKYHKVKELIIFWGAEESFFDGVNLLRLIVNTIKHSSGSSAAELLKNNSRYYYKLAMLCNLEIGDFQKDDEALMLSIDDLKYWGMVLSTFWEDLGRKIFI